MPNPDAPESACRPPLHDDGNGASPTDHLRDAAARLAEIKDYAAFYAAAKVDSYKSSAKSLALYAALGLLAAVAAVAILATAGALLVVGIAQGFTALFGADYAWAANLLTALLLLGGTLGATYFVIAKLLGKSRLATKRKYEDLKRQHLVKHGHNVHERATHAQPK